MNTIFHSQKTIALIGMMGVGKTSIGRRLAKKMDLIFNDSDYEVELASGCTVNDIYDIYGEKVFKDTERRVIDRLLAEGPHVISTGVGACTSIQTRKLLKDNAITVWLYADVNSIIPRITKRTHRPQLENGDAKIILEKLAAKYHPFYSQSDLFVDCTEKEAMETVELIMNSLKSYINNLAGVRD